MYTLLFGFLPQNKLAEVLCWTFLHSLWQGLLLAALAGALLMSTKRSSPLARYNILLGLVLVFAISSASTFFIEWRNRTVDEVSFAGQVKEQSGNSTVAEPDVTGATSIDPTFRIAELLDEYSGLVVLAWLLGFGVHCIRLASGFRYINRLRASATPVSTQWQLQLNELQARLGIRRYVGLMYCPKVNVPVVIGITRPLILLPLSLISHLPPAYIESILLHELAHIRRSDFAINLFQTALEAVFFFNPPLLWISSKLREEREACCDEMVLKEGKDRRSYLEALLYFQEKSLQPPHYAMALQSTSSHLLNRVKRMLTQENNKLNKMEKNMLVLGLVGLSALAFIPQTTTAVVSEVQQQPTLQVAPVLAGKDIPAGSAVATPLPATTSARVKARIEPAAVVAPVTPTDTIPAKKDKEYKTRSSRTTVENDGTSTSEIITAEPDGKTYRIKKANGKITEFSVDGKQIALTDLEPYQALIEDLERQARESDAQRAKANESRKRADIERRKAEMARSKTQQARRESEQFQRTQELESRMAEQASRAQVQRAQLDEKRRSLESKRSELQQQEQKIQEKRQAVQRTTSEIGAVIQDLQGENLIREGEAATFTLTSEQLTINGQTANNSVFQKLKAKHNISEGDSFQFQTDGKGTTRTTVVRN